MPLEPHFPDFVHTILSDGTVVPDLPNEYTILTGDTTYPIRELSYCVLQIMPRSASKRKTVDGIKKTRIRK